MKLKILQKNKRKNYIRTERELSKIPTDDSKFKYGRIDLIEKIIKDGKGVKRCDDGINRMEKEKQRENFRIILGFKEIDIYERKENSIIKKIKKVFPNEITRDQYKVSKYYIDLGYPVHKLGIEIDDNAHMDIPEAKEKETKAVMKKETGFKIIRINPDEENLIYLMKWVKYKVLLLSQLKE